MSCPVGLGRAARRLKSQAKARRVVGRVKPVAEETPVSRVTGGEPTTVPASPEPVHFASVPEAVFSAHFLEVSSQPSLPMTASAYVGLRGRTVSASQLYVHHTEGASIFTDWAAEVKSGNVFWLHYDGLIPDLLDESHLQAYGKWVRWQQRRWVFLEPGVAATIFLACELYSS